MLSEIKIKENKKIFLDEISSVKRPGIENLIKWLNDSDFFYAPSSTIYHNNFGGGLCDHSLNVFYSSVKLKDFYQKIMIKKGKTPVNITDDEIKICSLLHDVCKINFYNPIIRHYKDPIKGWIDYNGYEIKDKYPYGHGEKSVFMIENFMKLTGAEALAIRWHMGFTAGVMADIVEKKTLSKALEKTPLVGIISTADSMAAFFMEDTFVPNEML